LRLRVLPTVPIADMPMGHGGLRPRWTRGPFELDAVFTERHIAYVTDRVSVCQRRRVKVLNPVGDRREGRRASHAQTATVSTADSG
jgi:hypothetical protein